MKYLERPVSPPHPSGLLNFLQLLLLLVKENMENNTSDGKNVASMPVKNEGFGVEVIEILDDSDEDEKQPFLDYKTGNKDHNFSNRKIGKNLTEGPKTKKFKTDKTSPQNEAMKQQENTPQSFCMLNPKPSPIKIFATKQDEEPRNNTLRDCCWTLREMMGIDGDLKETIEFIVISTFIVDFEFLLEELPELLSIQNVLVIYGSKDNSEEQWKNYATQPDGSCSVDFVCRDPAAPKQTLTNPLNVQMNWGCHHTKMLLIGFSSGRLRVMIHTSNLRWADIHLKTQGAFIQDFLTKEKSKCGGESSEFERTLSFYLESYHYNKKRQWTSNEEACTLVQLIRKYDFSTAKGILIPSIPGFHKPRQDEVLGYLKVRKAIQTKLKAPKMKYPPSTSTSKSTAPIICQFSSIGSLSKPYLNAIWSAWDVASVHRVRPKTKDGYQNLRLVYPTVQEILESVEGINGGGSVPGREKNVQKQFLLPLYCKWASSDDPLRKSRNVPHIKTYYQINESGDSMDWFVLTSHNLSKAAWGEVQNGQWGETLKIFHWELGVFIYPEILQGQTMLPVLPDSLDQEIPTIPLPFKFNPDPYAAKDKPWTVDGI